MPVSFKQSQIQPGISKHRSNAVKVYCTEAIAENDIICVDGPKGNDFLAVSKADANGVLKVSRGLLYVADYAAAAGSYTPLALPFKRLTAANTAGSAVGAPVFLSDVAGGFSLTPGATPIQIGTVLVVGAGTAGQVLLSPQAFGSSSGAGASYATATFDHTGATDVEVQLNQPAGTVITDLGHVSTVATEGATNIDVRVGTASNGQEVVADVAYVSSGVAAIGDAMQVNSGTRGEAGAAMSLVTTFKPYTATARTLYYRFKCAGTISAGAIRPYIKFQYI